jgi:arylsulfatase A-like enzyme
VVDGFAYGADLTPTVLELAGLQPPDGLDGRSLLPTLAEGKPTPHDCIVTDCNALVTQRMIVQEKWGLVHTLFTGPFEHMQPIELFDITGDPEKDLASEHPTVVRDLRARLADWLDESLGGLPDRLHAAGLEGGWTLGSPPFLEGVFANLEMAKANKPLWETLCRKHGQFVGRLPGLLEKANWCPQAE